MSTDISRVQLVGEFDLHFDTHLQTGFSCKKQRHLSVCRINLVTRKELFKVHQRTCEVSFDVFV